MTQQGAKTTDISALEGIFVVLSVLITPLVLFAAHRASVERILYPAVNFLLAAYLYGRRSPWYPGQCVLVFCFAPLVRRLVDFQHGWDPSSPVLLTPYLCCLLAGFGFLRYWLRPNPRYLGAVLCMLACIAYGAIVAVFAGRPLAAMVDVLKWSIGPVFAIYMISEAKRHESMRRVVETSLVWAGAAMGIYGLVQDVIVPSWDAEWLRNVAALGQTSFGLPIPFAVRVFSTMNSPGSFGIAMMAGIVVALKRRPAVVALAVPPMLIGLALCQYRTLWAATAVAVTMVVFQRQARVRFSNLLVLGAMALMAFTVVLAVPRIRESLTHRVNSLTRLQSDASLNSRLSQYTDLARNDNLIAGEGLGINGISRRLDKGSGIAAIDGALIEIWEAMGVVVGTLFLLAMGALVAAVFVLPSGSGAHLYFDRAIVIATMIQLPMGTVHTGEMGFWAWMFLGFALGALLERRSSAVQAPGAGADQYLLGRLS